MRIRASIPVEHHVRGAGAPRDGGVSGTADRDLPPSPPLQPLAPGTGALAGSDVLVVFMESYGSATYDRPEFQRALQPARQRLADAIRDTGRGVVSAFVTSPTFGGGSVLAHLSLLSGVEVRDQDHYALLMTQDRPTLVSVFRSAGYRTVAVMPGLRQSWPEGAFYGFDQIYGAAGLDYRGPGFGWWRFRISSRWRRWIPASSTSAPASRCSSSSRRSRRICRSSRCRHCSPTGNAC